MLATQHGGYETLLACAKLPEAPKVRLDAIKALTSLLDGNPDPLDVDGFKV